MKRLRPGLCRAVTVWRCAVQPLRLGLLSIKHEMARPVVRRAIHVAACVSLGVAVRHKGIVGPRGRCRTLENAAFATRAGPRTSLCGGLTAFARNPAPAWLSSPQVRRSRPLARPLYPRPLVSHSSIASLRSWEIDPTRCATPPRTRPPAPHAVAAASSERPPIAAISPKKTPDPFSFS